MLLHFGIEAFNIDLEVFLARNILGQIQWEAVGIVERERSFTVNLATIIRSLIHHGLQQAHALVESTRKTLLFIFQRSDYVCLLFYQGRVRCAHLLNEGIGHAGKKQVFLTQFEAMAHGTPDNAPQDVSTTFVGRQYAI